jgi:hypothetical protein
MPAAWAAATPSAAWRTRATKVRRGSDGAAAASVGPSMSCMAM